MSSGTVYQRKDGRWVAAIRVDGKKASRYAATKREAQQKLRELRDQSLGRARPNTGEGSAGEPTVEPRQQPVRKRDVPTVAEFMDQWLASAGMKATTEESYRNNLVAHIIPAIGHLHLDEITPSDVAMVIASVRSKGRAERTAQYSYSITRSMLQVAVAWKLIPENPALRVKRPPARWEPRKVWTIEQTQTFITFCETKRGAWYELFLVALFSGLRLGELLGLDWSDVDWKRGSVNVRRSLAELKGGVFTMQTPKSAKSIRTVTLPTQAVMALRSRGPSESGPIFRRSNGEPPRRHAIAAQFKRACFAAGVPYIGVHGLRHQHVSLLAHAGVPVKAAQQRVGHSSPAITLGIYTHVLGDEDLRTVERLGELFSGGHDVEHDRTDE